MDRSEGDELVDVDGSDKFRSTGEEKLADDLVDSLCGMEGVPEHGLGPVFAEIGDGAASAVDAVELAHAAASSARRLSEAVLQRVLGDAENRLVRVRHNEQRAGKLRLQTLHQRPKGRVESHSVVVHLLNT